MAAFIHSLTCVLAEPGQLAEDSEKGILCAGNVYTDNAYYGIIKKVHSLEQRAFYTYAIHSLCVGYVRIVDTDLAGALHGLSQ